MMGTSGNVIERPLAQEARSSTVFNNSMNLALFFLLRDHTLRVGLVFVLLSKVEVIVDSEREESDLLKRAMTEKRERWHNKEWNGKTESHWRQPAGSEYARTSLVLFCCVIFFTAAHGRFWVGHPRHTRAPYGEEIVVGSSLAQHQNGI